MKLKEAIEILTKYTAGGNPWSITELTEASNLGIEAMKCVEGNRHYPQPTVYPLLPGETEGDENEHT